MSPGAGAPDRPGQARGRWLWSRSAIILLGFLAIAGFLLVVEHAAHLFGILPYLLLLACPLLHFFHGSHGRHQNGHGSPPGTERAS